MGGKPSILIIGQDGGVSDSVRMLGFQPVVADQSPRALEKEEGSAPSLVLINLLPGESLEPKFLRQLSQNGLPIVILADPDGDSGDVPRKNGKIQVLARPVDDATLRTALQEALRRNAPACRTGATTRGAHPNDRYRNEYAPFFDQSPAMRVIRGIIEQVANTNATVLIRGESGVGKDLVARAIHYASPRSEKPFVKVNCAALPAELLESELFGHEKGAFTGAYRRKLGKFEFANNGSLFLDEIGELPLALQAKLLHILQDQEFSRVGGREMIRVDSRVIASTNRDLETALAAGQFREDLYYRLNVVEIKVPPLRERRDEIPGLIRYFLDKFQRQYGRRISHPPEIFRGFTQYRWPGNVRELENLVRRLVVLGSDPQIEQEILSRLSASHLPQAEPTVVAGTQPLSAGDEVAIGLREIARRAAREAERRAIAEVLDRVHWNRTKAARLLKISYKTLLTKIAECGLAAKERRRA